jgi:hypothetical protein
VTWTIPQDFEFEAFQIEMHRSYKVKITNEVFNLEKKWWKVVFSGGLPSR